MTSTENNLPDELKAMTVARYPEDWTEEDTARSTLLVSSPLIPWRTAVLATRVRLCPSLPWLTPCTSA